MLTVQDVYLLLPELATQTHCCATLCPCSAQVPLSIAAKQIHHPGSLIVFLHYCGSYCCAGICMSLFAFVHVVVSVFCLTALLSSLSNGYF